MLVAFATQSCSNVERTEGSVTHEQFALELSNLKTGGCMAQYRNSRPESPKGKIWTAFQKSGADAAFKLAEKLDVARHRVSRWIVGGGKGFQAAAQSHDEKPKPKKKSAAKKQPAKKAVKKTPAAPQAELQAA
jgi:hypothetical protein